MGSTLSGVSVRICTTKHPRTSSDILGRKLPLSTNTRVVDRELNSDVFLMKVI